MNTLPLTVLVPCRNERLNIGPCIESFHALADEILIADSLSDDNTVEIVQRYSKVRVIEREYRTSGDFKNWAIPQAAHAWILLLDADERITPELADEIRQILSADEDSTRNGNLTSIAVADGYWIYRDNHFMGHPVNYGDSRTDRTLRLFRRDLCRYEGPSDHAEVAVSTGNVASLKNHLVHYSFWDYDQYFKKFDRYTTLQAKQWYDAGHDTSYFQLLTRPVWRFFREYVIQGGFLDGAPGLQLSWLAAFYTFTKQARLWQLQHGLKQPIPDSAKQSAE